MDRRWTVAVFIVCVMVGIAWADLPGLVNYQGELNEAGGPVTGGRLNTASGGSSSVSGGMSNGAHGVRSTVSGGANDGVANHSDWRAGDLFQEN